MDTFNEVMSGGSHLNGNADVFLACAPLDPQVFGVSGGGRSERWLTRCHQLTHEHDVGDSVFIEVEIGKYVPARVIEVLLQPDQVHYRTTLQNSYIRDRYVLTADERNRRRSDYFRTLRRKAELRLRNIAQLMENNGSF